MPHIPDFLSHLEVKNDYPVPFIVYTEDGDIRFREIDSRKVEQCLEECKCGICGKPIVPAVDDIWFIGGDNCKRLHAFFDPPMHEKCATFAYNICPFLLGQDVKYKFKTNKYAVISVPSASMPVLSSNGFGYRKAAFVPNYLEIVAVE